MPQIDWHASYPLFQRLGHGEVSRVMTGQGRPAFATAIQPSDLLPRRENEYLVQIEGDLFNELLRGLSTTYTAELVEDPRLGVAFVVTPPEQEEGLPWQPLVG